MPPIVEMRAAAKAAVVLCALLFSAAVVAAEPDAASPLREKIEQLEEQFHQQELLALRRVEGVEVRMETLDRNINRVFLIFGLSAALILAFVIGHQRARNRLDSERVNRAVRETETLNADIRRELNRPEMEFLRVGHFLRRLMRQFAENGVSAGDIVQIRVIGNDPNMPVSLHYTAQVLAAEYEERWHDAEESLEQLRQLDAEDPFVLLHLSHVHTRIAEQKGDVRDRKRHLQTASRYYAQFAVAAQMETETPARPQIPPSPPAPQKAAVAAPPRTEIQSRQTPAPPVTVSKTPEAKPQFAPPPRETGIRPPSAIAQKPPPPTVAAASGDSESRENVPPRPSAPPQSEIVKPRTPTISAPPETVPKTVPESAPSAVVSPKPVFQKPESESAKPAPSPATAETAQKSRPEIAAQTREDAPPPETKINGETKTVPRGAAAGVSWNAIGVALSAIKSGSANLLSDVRGAAGKIVGGADGGPPPFLPVPAASEVPEKAGAAETEMWKCIRRGDLRMAQAANAPGLRRRNRLIDQALACYAQAQGHRTNETLYLNWGLSLLGKALHLPEKKREPFFNAAIDKFLAGNVIAPHRFDFSLATLYAIIGREMECRQWLAAARESGTLDAESLRHAPDFDGVRRQPWFAEFMRG
ncbi:MAG: hypothetical protein ACR2QC_09695 [Gammaproteobacteria bacterium]